MKLRWMDFEFDVGTEEKHRVEYSFSRWWGTTYIRVDGEIVLKYLTLLYGGVGIPFGVVSFVLYFLFNFEVLFLSLGSILMVAPVLTSSIIYRKKFPITLTVGEKEKHIVQIETKWPKIIGFRGIYTIYIDNELFKTFKA